MFLGTFTPKLLPKNQLVLPAKLRDSLGGNRAILTVGFDQCIYGFSLSDWQQITQNELIKPLLSIEGRRIRQRVFSSSEEVTLDAQGRFVLPEFLKTFAKIQTDIVIIGAGDHFELWDQVQWDKLQINLLTETYDHTES